ncbi:MAG: aldo/keto reductase [Lacipirellulaceae bacterium]
MESTTLGNSGLEVSRLGFGGCPLGGHGWGNDSSDAEGVAAVRKALELGVTFFDTADVYGLGRSEELLSEALGDARHEVVIATKFGVRWDLQGNTRKDISPDYVRTALEASLRRLRLECIPLYYVHWPDGVTPVEEIVGELECLRSEGKIGAIGLSNFSPEKVKRAAEVAPISALQIQYSLVDRSLAEEASETTQATDTPLVTWGSLAQGLLSGKYDVNSRFEENDRRSRYENFQGEKFHANLRVVDALKQIAARVGKSPAQTAMRWLLDTDGVGSVLFGAKRPQQVVENLGAADWQLSEASYQQLIETARDADRARAA